MRKTLLTHILAATIISAGCINEVNQSPPASDNEVPFSTEGTFEKIERDPPVEEMDILDELNSYDLSGLSWGRVAVKQGREHMVPNQSQNQFALYEDETFVLDIGYLTHSVESIDEHDVQVLANFEPVEFHWIEVGDGDFPSMESIEQLPPESLAKSFRFQLTDDTPSRFTAVIPPESFDRAQAYDIRILVTPRHVTDGSAEIAKYGDINLSFSATLYFGSRDFVVDLNELEEPLSKPVTREILGGMAPTSSSLLVPAGSEIPTNLLEPVPSQDLTAWFFASGPLDLDREPTEEVVTMLVKEGKIVGEARLATAAPLPNRSFEGVNVSGREVSIDGPGRYTFVTFRKPLQDLGSVPRRESLTGVSNTVIVR